MKKVLTKAKNSPFHHLTNTLYSHRFVTGKMLKLFYKNQSREQQKDSITASVNGENKQVRKHVLNITTEKNQTFLRRHETHWSQLYTRKMVIKVAKEFL